MRRAQGRMSTGANPETSTRQPQGPPPCRIGQGGPRVRWSYASGGSAGPCTSREAVRKPCTPRTARLCQCMHLVCSLQCDGLRVGRNEVLIPETSTRLPRHPPPCHEKYDRGDERVLYRTPRETPGSPMDMSMRSQPPTCRTNW